MKYLFYTILILIPLNLLAQNPVNSGNLNDGFKIMRGDSKTNPFLTEEWHVGYGIYENGNTTRPQKMNYDIHGNNLVYQTSNSNEVMKLLDQDFTGFILKGNNEEYLFTKIKGNQFDKEKNADKYYRIVKAPSRKVIVEFEKDLDDPNNSGWQSSNQNTRNPEYELKTSYYVLRKDGKYEEVKLKNKSLLKIFEDKEDQLKNYLKTNQIDIETPEDLLRVTEYYYSI